MSALHFGVIQGEKSSWLPFDQAMAAQGEAAFVQASLPT
jgi:hypothetical protein